MHARRVLAASALAITALTTTTSRPAEATSVVAGTVTNDFGEPAQGVTVEICTTTFLCSSTEVDADGNYSIGGLADGTYTIEFQGATGFDALGRHADEYWEDQPDRDSATQITLPADAGTDYDAVVTRQPILSGAITSDSGGPLENALALACRVTDGITRCTAARSAADGTYELQLERVDYDYVEFRDESGAHARKFWPDVDRRDEASPLLTADGVDVTADAELERLSSISGLVTDEAGTPLEGIRVEAYGTGGSRGGANTAADGSYRMWVQEDSYTVVFRAYSDQYQQEYWDDVTSQSDATPVVIATRSDIDLGTTDLVELAAVSGTVTDAEGTGRSGVDVLLCDTTCSGGRVASTRTNSSGDYSLAAVPGDYLLYFGGTFVGLDAEYHDDVAEEEDATPITLTLGAPLSIDADLDSGGTISGRVTDLDGDPIPDLSLRASPYLGDFGRTDSDGNYTIEVPAGSYDVTMNLGSTVYFGATPIPVEVTIGEDVTGVDFVLREFASLTGTVTDTADNPLDGITVVVTSETSGTNTSTSTTADGTYEFTRVIPGPDHIIEFRSNAWENEFHDDVRDAESATPLTFDNGESRVVDAALDSGGVIAGTVTNASGAPVDTVRVNACSSTGCRSARTTASGTYVIGGLETGEYSVRFDDRADVYVDQYWNAQPSSVTADSVAVVWNVVSGGIDATMTRAASISGRVSSNGAPLAELGVLACNSSGRCDNGSAVTDEGGRYTIDGLLPGTYTVLARDLTPPRVYGSRLWNGGATIRLESGTRRTGIDIELVRGGRITGTVTDADDDPISAVYVEACSPTVPECRWALSEPDGTYEIDAVEPANDWIVSFDTTWRSSAPLRPVEFYCDAEDEVDALPISVGSNRTTSRIDASMRLAGDADHDTCDTDGDGVADPVDNCTNARNSGQSDVDGDRVGDACDGDDDRAVVERLNPLRYADSRDLPTFDGRFRDTGARRNGTTWEIQVAGRGNVPASATAAVINLTVLNARTPGFATVHPCGRRPVASSVNYGPGQIEPNELIAKLSDRGTICVFTLTAADVIVDVVGAISNSPLMSLTPARYGDSRDQPTFDGRFRNTGIRRGGTTWKIDVAGRGAVPSDAAAVVVNLTVTQGQTSGFATVYPCGERPLASSLNWDPGVTRPNELIARLSSDGALCVFVSADVHVIVDVVGALPDVPQLTTIRGTRFADSRALSTFDGRFRNTGIRRAGTVWSIDVAGRGPVPAEADAVIANVTVTGASLPGFATIYDCGKRPSTSSLNYGPGVTRPNEVIAGLSDTGQLCVYTLTDVDVVVDIVGHTG